ncbi:SNF2 helicase associated domain-containing protein [candidate division KSB1 bacterium]|nr:SNF2 helicase associated domain-containing protein [candidate division KSB1 bacterium]
MKLTEEQLLQFAGAATFESGKRLYQAGSVHLNQVELDHFDAQVLNYQVRIRQTSSGLFALCTCPSWGHCEHSVAALLAARDYYEKNREDLLQRRIHPSWQQFFSALVEKNQKKHRYDTTHPIRWKIIYTIKLEQDGWSLLPQKAYIKRNGEFGRIATIGQFDSDDSEVEYNENDLFIISYLMRLNLRQQFAKWQTPSYYYDFRPVFYPYGMSMGFIFYHLKQSPLYLDNEGLVGQALSLSDRTAQVEFSYSSSPENLEITPEIIHGSERHKLGPDATVLTENPIWILKKDQLLHIDNIDMADALIPFTQERLKIQIPRAESDLFLTRTLPSLAEFMPLRIPDTYQVTTIESLTAQKLLFSESETHLIIQLQFGYEGYYVDYSDPHGQKIMIKTPSKLIRIARQQTLEEETAERLVATGLKNEAGSFQIDNSRAMNWIFRNIANLVAQGFEMVGLDHLHNFHIRTAEPYVQMQVGTEIDWFDLNMEINIEGVPVSLHNLRRAFRQNQPYLKLSDGSLAILPSLWMQRYSHLFNFAQIEDGRIRLQPHHLTLIDLLFEEADVSAADEAFEIRRAKFRNFSHIEPRHAPPSMEKVLRPYQKTGYDWLCFLKSFHFGGCLADDMGLGKTLQTLTLLLNEKNSSPERHTSLIVCPTSVVFNWQNEVKKFTPSLTVLAHIGLDREDDTESLKNFDIILTTYGIMRRDIALLRRFSFYYIILDESQKIKNPTSQTAKAARLLNGRYRLALTGTPIENNTQELWSQFAFLNPGLLGSLNYFKRQFINPIEKEENQETVNFLHKLVFPFILRRSKENVAMDLPPKTEQTILCTMSDKQSQLYIQWRDHYRALLLKKIDEQGIDKARINILEGLVRLRQIACHPYLIDQQIHEDSGKFEHLKEFVDEILAENHKILIFSQFVRMLKLIRRYFDKRGISYEYLDGHTVHRQRVVQRFQEDASIKTFLISLKAGGTGLNLTAADYVILYDPWWNPAVETQAMDRAHRIGQDKNVFVYRLITQNSVEEKMLALQEKKKKLVSTLITSDKNLKSLTREDIESLFS